MIEEMKNIKDYKGEYEIKKNGRVWSYKRKKFLKPMLTMDGYHRVSLYKEGKRKTYYIHRLVAQTFIPNPEGLPEVNHKDEDKSNNCVENLEWMSKIDNINYGTGSKRSAEKRSKPIYCVELDKVFKSGKEAARELGLNNSHITSCCKGRYKTTGGFHFRYAETSVEEV